MILQKIDQFYGRLIWENPLGYGGKEQPYENNKYDTYEGKVMKSQLICKSMAKKWSRMNRKTGRETLLKVLIGKWMLKFFSQLTFFHQMKQYTDPYKGIKW